MVYDTNPGDNTLHPRIFYALYIGQNDTGNSQLIFKLSMQQILVKAKYQPIHVHEDIFEAINETG